jgi:hypothetical protein
MEGDIGLHPHGSPTRPINIATQRGNHDAVVVMAKACIQQHKTNLFETTNLVGRTPAYISVERNFPICLGILSKAGADLRRACPLYVVLNGSDHNVDPRPHDFPGHHALASTVRSFVNKECTNCGEHSQADKQSLLKCGRCQMAYYCSIDCQKKNYKTFHKLCCKSIKQGTDMVRYIGAPLPSPSIEYFGPKDMTAEDSDYVRDSHPVWEYDAGLSSASGGEDGGNPQSESSRWQRYPPRMEEDLESLMQLGSPQYMYKPNDPECTGMEERELTMRPPSRVSTRHVYFSDMVERDVYTGAGRSVRRNGTQKVPAPSDPLW